MIRIKSIFTFIESGPRENQEDYIIATSDTTQRIFVLCDGMGGHGHGEVASKIVAESVHSYLTELNPQNYSEEHLQVATEFALEELAKADNFSDEKSMGTTLVVIAVNRMNILVGHIGDSRCYLFNGDGEKKFRTKDHSKVQEAVEAEILTEEEAWSSPKKNILTRCLQSESKGVRLEIDTLAIEDGDTILICSDGVTDALRDSQLQALLIGRDASDFGSCIKLECELSSRDNFSGIVITFSQDEPNTIEKNKALSNALNQDTAPQFCSYCGGHLNPSSVFCPQCGRKIGDSYTSELTSPIASKEDPDSIIPTDNKKISSWMIIGGSLILGGVIGGLIGYSLAPDPEPIHKLSGAKERIFVIDKVSEFINGMCQTDSLTDDKDSLLRKEDVLSRYQIFRDKILMNEKQNF